MPTTAPIKNSFADDLRIDLRGQHLVLPPITAALPKSVMVTEKQTKPR